MGKRNKGRKRGRKKRRGAAKATSQPKNTQPERAQPESAEPESAEPESAEPESAEPESAEPESPEPGSAQPELAEEAAASSTSAKGEATAPDPVSTEGLVVRLRRRAAVGLVVLATAAAAFWMQSSAAEEGLSKKVRYVRNCCANRQYESALEAVPGSWSFWLASKGHEREALLRSVAEEFLAHLAQECGEAPREGPLDLAALSGRRAQIRAFWKEHGALEVLEDACSAVISADGEPEDMVPLWLLPEGDLPEARQRVLASVRARSEERDPMAVAEALARLDRGELASFLAHRGVLVDALFGEDPRRCETLSRQGFVPVTGTAPARLELEIEEPTTAPSGVTRTYGPSRSSFRTIDEIRFAALGKVSLRGMRATLVATLSRRDGVGSVVERFKVAASADPPARLRIGVAEFSPEPREREIAERAVARAHAVLTRRLKERLSDWDWD